MLAIFLYCCPYRLSCPANAIEMGGQLEQSGQQYKTAIMSLGLCMTDQRSQSTVHCCSRLLLSCLWSLFCKNYTDSFNYIWFRATSNNCIGLLLYQYITSTRHSHVLGTRNYIVCIKVVIMSLGSLCLTGDHKVHTLITMHWGFQTSIIYLMMYCASRELFS